MSSFRNWLGVEEWSSFMRFWTCKKLSLMLLFFSRVRSGTWRQCQGGSTQGN
jgi:hypothetical protein